MYSPSPAIFTSVRGSSCQTPPSAPMGTANITVTARSAFWSFADISRSKSRTLPLRSTFFEMRIPFASAPSTGAKPSSSAASRMYSPDFSGAGFLLTITESKRQSPAVPANSLNSTLRKRALPTVRYSIVYRLTVEIGFCGIISSVRRCHPSAGLTEKRAF